MATAERVTVTEEVVQTVEREVIRLELSLEEAQTLRNVLGLTKAVLAERLGLHDLFVTLTDTAGYSSRGIHARITEV